MSNHTSGEITELKEIVCIKILEKGQAQRKHLINVKHFFFLQVYIVAPEPILND